MNNDLLAFWRDQGAEWATQEASEHDLGRIGAIAQRAANHASGLAAEAVVADLKAIWAAGFSSPEDAIPWDEMQDMLPDQALLAFVQGAADVWRKRPAS